MHVQQGRSARRADGPTTERTATTTAALTVGGFVLPI